MNKPGSILLTDAEGHSLPVLEVDGLYFPHYGVSDHADIIRSIKTWKGRSDDVIILSYPKSGSHWLWDMTYQLVNQKADVVHLTKGSHVLEFMTMTEENLNSLPSPRVLNSHMHFRFLPKDLLTKKCKVIYLIRDPKDVAVSFYNHHVNFPMLYNDYSGQWENSLPMFLQGKVDYGSWFDHLKDCEIFMSANPNYPIHIIKYEDLKENGFRELQKLDIFLGLNNDVSLIEDIVNKSQFEKMKKEKRHLIDLNIIPELTMQIYRKGEVGDWKNWFTDEQKEEFDSVFEQNMTGSKFYSFFK